MSTKKKNITKFDDTMLPVSRISREQSDKIEKLVTPLLDKGIEELRVKNPELFNNNVL